MSDDEEIAFLLAALLCAFGWYRLLAGGRGMSVLRRGPGDRWLVAAALLSIAGLSAALRLLASADVRDSPLYLGFYLFMGFAWIGAGLAVCEWLGLSWRDDVRERGNAAAAPALLGAALGLAACFAGGNVGDGPGWWVVVFSAGLASAAWCVLWGVAASVTGAIRRITIDRDPATGMRWGGFLAASGLLLGRAVAGSWDCAEATLRDFLRLSIWSLAPLALLIAGERPLRSGDELRRPALSGAPVAILQLLLAAALCWKLGMPR